MKFTYVPKGVCSKKFDIEIVDGIIKDIKIHGGCSGNTQGIEKLCIGRQAKEIASTLQGIKCGFKSTSCPDQLSKAIKEHI